MTAELWVLSVTELEFPRDIIYFFSFVKIFYGESPRRKQMSALHSAGHQAVDQLLVHEDKDAQGRATQTCAHPSSPRQSAPELPASYCEYPGPQKMFAIQTVSLRERME